MFPRPIGTEVSTRSSCEAVRNAFSARDFPGTEEPRQRPGRRFPWRSTGVETWFGWAKPKHVTQLVGRQNPARAAMQIADAVESFDDEGHQKEQPADQNTVGMVVTDVLQSVAVLGIMEALIFDFPTALGEVIQREATDAA